MALPIGRQDSSQPPSKHKWILLAAVTMQYMLYCTARAQDTLQMRIRYQRRRPRLEEASAKITKQKTYLSTGEPLRELQSLC